MLLRKLQSPRIAVPVGMSLICTGLLLNAVSQVLMRSLHASATLSANTVDFIRGFCIGLGITLEIAGIAAMLPAVRARRRGNGSLPPQS